MKSFFTKLGLTLSLILLIGGASSCVQDNYIDCSNAEVEIVNNTGYYIYFSTSGDYCSAADYIPPYSSVIISYGSIHTTTDMPGSMDVYYRYGGPGYADSRMSVDIYGCYQKQYIY